MSKDVLLDDAVEALNEVFAECRENLDPSILADTLMEAARILRESPATEDTEENEPWTPGLRDKYWYITELGWVEETQFYPTMSDDERMEIGNVFEDRADAIESVRWLRARANIMASTKGFRWKRGQMWWSVYWTETKGLGVIGDQTIKSSPIVFASREDAEKSITRYKEDWLVYLGVEEWDG